MFETIFQNKHRLKVNFQNQSFIESLTFRLKENLLTKLEVCILKLFLSLQPFKVGSIFILDTYGLKFCLWEGFQW